MHLLPLLRSKTISRSLIFSTSGHTVCLDDPSTTQCAQKAKKWKKLLAADPFIQKSPQIHRKLPTRWGISGNLWVFANATARSRDSAPRGQGGGSPPCTSCLLRAKQQCLGPELIPALGALCTLTTVSPHSAPRKPKTGIKYSQLIRFTKSNPVFTRYGPKWARSWWSGGVSHMLQQGPGIARRADRAGVLPLAPLAAFAP